MTLAVKLDGEKYKEAGFPSKEGHKFKGYECTNGVELTWKSETWKALIETDKPTVCTLEFETADNLKLNGSEPVVKEGLVPVIIADNGTVTKTETDDINWYDYNESKWANAVILTGIDNYQVGDTIPEEAIESYFVWIPKYKYKLFNVEGNEIPAQEIEVEIGDYDTVNSDTECIAQNKSGDNGTCTNGKWMTHPAFTSLGVNGLWVGKFETTGSTDKVTVKPNQVSLTNINASTMYNTAFNYKRGLDSHMMKNTEWGAMAYITNSKYGRGNTEVWVNNYWNNRETLTGCVGSGVGGAESSNCENRYGAGGNNIHGSTTDNISGIYDTSGGSWDYVMANLNNTQDLSGLNPSNVNDRYINRYVGEDLTYKILGDATGETKGWNGDYSIFLTSSHSWLYRGGGVLYGQQGIFAFFHSGADTGGALTFRIVLCPTV